MAVIYSLQSAACTYRVALGPRAGQKVLTLQTVPLQESPYSAERCVNAHGFSLHAQVRCAMNQRNKLERLCRYITRPAITGKGDRPRFSAFCYQIAPKNLDHRLGA